MQVKELIALLTTNLRNETRRFTRVKIQKGYLLKCGPRFSKIRMPPQKQSRPIKSESQRGNGDATPSADVTRQAPHPLPERDKPVTKFQRVANGFYAHTGPYAKNALITENRGEERSADFAMTKKNKVAQPHLGRWREGRGRSQSAAIGTSDKNRVYAVARAGDNANHLPMARAIYAAKVDVAQGRALWTTSQSHGMADFALPSPIRPKTMPAQCLKKTLFYNAPQETPHQKFYPLKNSVERLQKRVMPMRRRDLSTPDRVAIRRPIDAFSYQQSAGINLSTAFDAPAPWLDFAGQTRARPPRSRRAHLMSMLAPVSEDVQRNAAQSSALGPTQKHHHGLLAGKGLSAHEKFLFARKYVSPTTRPSYQAGVLVDDIWRKTRTKAGDTHGAKSFENVTKGISHRATNSIPMMSLPNGSASEANRAQTIINGVTITITTSDRQVARETHDVVEKLFSQPQILASQANIGLM